MNEAGRCEECGAVLDTTTPEGLCIRCVVATLSHFVLEAKPAAAAEEAAESLELWAEKAPQHIPAAQPEELRRSRRVGDYELQEEIARGGMGVVFRARQVSLNRVVALKMIALGKFASPTALARFRAEAQTAARLRHSHIVAIHEVGEIEGQPFFSMDYIEGQNLAQLVGNQPLTALRAAELLKTIADTVQFAHEQGVLHRDLKPSNVLIDSAGQPHLTDFGLAKQMKGDADAGDLTSSGQVLGSPNFMPPEQAAATRGHDGPPSDVHSLGAILYYLVTGRPPFHAQTIAEVLRQVVASEPPPPHLLNPGTPRDLETICLKCLEKEPVKRYRTPRELAEELKRFLADEPIHARPLSRVEKTWRWCHRKPAMASLLLSTLVLLFIVAIGSPIAVLRISREQKRAQNNARKEQQQRLRAEENAAKSQQVAQVLKEMLKGVKPSIALGRDATLLREILARTTERLGEDWKDQPAVEAELRATIGEVHLDLGEYAKAEEMFRQALALNRKLFGNEHEDVVASLASLSMALDYQGKHVEAEPFHRENLALARKLFGNEHPTVSDALNSLALGLLDEGKCAEAETAMREALAIDRKVLGSTNLNLADSINNLASALICQEKFGEAEALARESLDVRRKLLPGDQPGVADGLHNLAAILDREGKTEEAEKMYRETLVMERKVLPPEHPSLAASLYDLGNLLQRQGRLPEAERLCREALSILHQAVGKQHLRVANVLTTLAAVLYDERRYPESEACYCEALEMRRRLLGNLHLEVAKSLCYLAAAMEAQDKESEAEPLYREALEVRRKLLGNDHPEVADSMAKVAVVLDAQHKYPEAELLYREFLQIHDPRLGPEYKGPLPARAALGRLLADWAWAERAAKSENLPEGGTKAEMSARAREAEALLRECLAEAQGSTNVAQWRVADIKSRFGGALLVRAVLDSSLDNENRAARLAEAERFMLEGNEGLQQADRSARRERRDALERLVRLYTAWNAVVPGNGKSIQAQQWTQTLESFPTQPEHISGKQQ